MKTTYTLPQLHAQTKSNRDKDKMDILLTRDVLPLAVSVRHSWGSLTLDQQA